MRTRLILPTIFMGFGLVAASSLYVLPQLLKAQEEKPLNGAGINSPWTAKQVLHSADLNRMLSDKRAAQPKIFHVGFEVLYKSKHIPGSIYAGPGSKDAGLDALKLAVANVPKDSQIILYCGCCPWDHCPNMKPAFTLLQGMGFKQIKVLEIPTNFSKDWIDLGFPVEGATAGGSAGR
jgi:thiosulfate/3-mercaptopyruvate sulfurtransferase